MARRKQAKLDFPSIGHNSGALTADQRDKLSGLVSEIERVNAEVKELTSERATIYKSAKEAGFDTKAIKEVVRQRAMERSKRTDWENAVDVYKHALGMLADTPLGKAAIRAAAAGEANGTSKDKKRKGGKGDAAAGTSPGEAEQSAGRPPGGVMPDDELRVPAD